MRKTKWKAKERSKDAQPTGIEEGRELVLVMVRSYLTHSPFNVTFVQTVSFNNNKRPIINICCQCNLPLYNKG